MSETTEAEAPAPENGASLSVSDIMNTVKIIDFACEQGAFKGWTTLENVARVRARLLAFIQNVAPDLLNPPQAGDERPVSTEVSPEAAETAQAA